MYGHWGSNCSGEASQKPGRVREVRGEGEAELRDDSRYSGVLEAGGCSISNKAYIKLS